MRIAFATLTTAGMAFAALAGLPLVSVAPNRLVSGEGVSGWAMLAQVRAGIHVSTIETTLPVLLLTALLALIGIGVFARQTRLLNLGVIAGTATLILALLGLCGAYAAQVALAQSPYARTSLGSAFWLVTLMAWLAVMDRLHAMQAPLWLRGLVWAGWLAGAWWLAASGSIDQLSLMKEYANHADTLGAAVARHLEIVVLTLVPTLCLGIPMGWVLHRWTRLQAALMPVLNTIQTIPSIALFGLLMVPLAWMAKSWPTLASWGVSGIGLAPAVVALTLYSLLPVVRATLAGLAQVPAGVLQAARGMGMGAARILWQAQLPLAAPVILAGVRTAALQTVGLAAVAALIGAGGLGAIMFDGLFSTAHDLVLLAVLPILGLALVCDAVFVLFTLLARRSLKGEPT